MGYGFGGGNEPFCFALKDGQDLNLSFIKLILSTKPLNLLHVPQISPFDVDLGQSIPQSSFIPRHLPNFSPVQHNLVVNSRMKMPELKQQLEDEWVTIIIPIIQRRYPENL